MRKMKLFLLVASAFLFVSEAYAITCPQKCRQECRYLTGDAYDDCYFGCMVECHGGGSCKPLGARCESGSECCSKQCGLYQEGAFCDDGWPVVTRRADDAFNACVKDCMADGTSSGECQLWCQ